MCNFKADDLMFVHATLGIMGNTLESVVVNLQMLEGTGFIGWWHTGAFKLAYYYAIHIIKELTAADNLHNLKGSQLFVNACSA